MINRRAAMKMLASLPGMSFLRPEPEGPEMPPGHGPPEYDEMPLLIMEQYAFEREMLGLLRRSGRIDCNRTQALDELAQQAQDLDMGY